MLDQPSELPSAWAPKREQVVTPEGGVDPSAPPSIVKLQAEPRPAAETSKEEVAIGKNDFLFLVGGNQRVLAFVSGQVSFSYTARKIFYDNVRARGGYCRDHKISYCHVVFPDKHSVMPEKFPFEIKVPIGRLTYEFCKGEFIYPVAELAALGESAYLKTDTHMTVHGQMEMVRQCILGLKLGAEFFEDKRSAITALWYEQDNFCGDLGQKLDQKPTERRLRSRKPDGVAFFCNNPVGNVGAIHVAINRKAKHKLLIFGDSFSIDCLYAFGLLFREVIIVRSPYFHRDIVKLFGPTHLITSNAERYLINMPMDTEAPVPLFMLDLLKKESRPDNGYFEAMNALLQPGSLTYRRYMELGEIPSNLPK